jgi:PleD family two-component response regulator
MVFCVVEDLMFSSKLRAAATQTGAAIRFVRSPDALLAEARQERPALVILDLNADRLQPLAIVAALRAEPDLAGIRTLGFVSHVQADRVAAARAAGVDEVMARSAFVAQLPGLLRTAHDS